MPVLEARMTHPVFVLPDVFPALQAISEATKEAGLPAGLLELMHLRASQINGCGVCVDMHPRLASKEGESQQRLFAVAAWRDTPYFSDAERAALALTEELTRIADRPEAVPDALWEELAGHFDERQLAGLLLGIGIINMWNRLNLATRQVAGQAWT